MRHLSVLTLGAFLLLAPPTASLNADSPETSLIASRKDHSGHGRGHGSKSSNWSGRHQEHSGRHYYKHKGHGRHWDHRPWHGYSSYYPGYYTYPYPSYYYYAPYYYYVYPDNDPNGVYYQSPGFSFEVGW